MMEFAALLHTVSYSGSWGQARLSLEETISKAADLGFDGVLAMAKRPHLSPLDFPPSRRQGLRERLEERGLKFALAGYNNFTADFEHRDVPNLEIQVQYVTELARLTADLGGSLVRIFTGYEHPAASYPVAWDLVVRALKECSQRAAEFGVTIGVQNHHDIGCGWESQRDLIEAVDEPNCRALYDAWAPVLHGADPLEGARALAALTAHTTMANYARRPRYVYVPEAVNYRPLLPHMQAVAIDEGIIDYGAFLDALYEGGFRGSVAYEMCSPLVGGGGQENLDRCACRFLEFFRTWRAARSGVGTAKTGV